MRWSEAVEDVIAIEWGYSHESCIASLGNGKALWEVALDISGLPRLLWGASCKTILITAGIQLINAGSFCKYLVRTLTFSRQLST